MAKDPVCTKKVDGNRALDKSEYSEYRGEFYYFCSPSCKKAFDDKPDAYAVDSDDDMDMYLDDGDRCGGV